MISERTKSLLLLLGLLALYGAVGIRWGYLLDPSLGMDWLLAGIWLVMTALLVWRPDARRDAPLIGVAMAGGLVIEWWGTNSGLWRYFTDERPPAWILPAWPIAAIAIDRLHRLALHHLPALRRLRALYWVLIPGFVLAMIRFLWPTIHLPASQVVVALMVGVAVLGVQRERDTTLFVVGAAAGLFLEYWGTSRRCWIYLTAQTPPPEAVLAHGFASIAFARGAGALRWVLAQRTLIAGASPPRGQPRPQRWRRPHPLCTASSRSSSPSPLRDRLPDDVDS